MKASKPKPFQRPAVSVGRIEREWKTVPAKDLSIGDTIAGFGRIVNKLDFESSSGIAIAVHGQENNTQVLDSEDKVFAFVLRKKN